MGTTCQTRLLEPASASAAFTTTAGSGRHRDPLACLDSSISSVDSAPIFMDSRRESRHDFPFHDSATSRVLSATSLPPILARQTSSGSSIRCLAAKLATSGIDRHGEEDDLLPADLRSPSQSSVESHHTAGLSDSLVFLRKKSSLSEIEEVSRTMCVDIRDKK